MTHLEHDWLEGGTHKEEVASQVALPPQEDLQTDGDVSEVKADMDTTTHNASNLGFSSMPDLAYLIHAVRILTSRPVESSTAV